MATKPVLTTVKETFHAITHPSEDVGPVKPKAWTVGPGEGTNRVVLITSNATYDFEAQHKGNLEKIAQEHNTSTNPVPAAGLRQ